MNYTSKETSLTRELYDLMKKQMFVVAVINSSLKQQPVHTGTFGHWNQFINLSVPALINIVVHGLLK